MNLKTKDNEFELQFTTADFTRLKNMLKVENLRKTLIQGAKTEDYEMLARALCVFSENNLKRNEDAYVCIDDYCVENEKTRYEMFLELISEMSEAGFFKERLTLEEVKELAEAPAIDTDEITEQALRMFQGDALQELVKEMLQENTTTTGANESTTYDPLLTPAV